MLNMFKKWQTFSDWIEQSGKGEQISKKSLYHISFLSSQKINWGLLTGTGKSLAELIQRI